MKDTYIFKRVEKKYRLTEEKKNILLSKISDRLLPDVHGRSTVCSLYLDTADYLIIRNSIDAKVYKEKLRIRSYGVPEDSSKVFFEIKKKYKGVVYKRRVSMTYSQAIAYLDGGKKPFGGQIMDEIDWAMRFYRYPTPRILICYEREAYTSAEDAGLRITFDTGVRYRTDALDPGGGDAGSRIIPDGTVLMEIKTGGGMPIWLADALDELEIYPSRFSKYGTAYGEIIKSAEDTNCIHEKGEIYNA